MFLSFWNCCILFHHYQPSFIFNRQQFCDFAEAFFFRYQVYMEPSWASSPSPKEPQPSWLKPAEASPFAPVPPTSSGPQAIPAYPSSELGNSVRIFFWLTFSLVIWLIIIPFLFSTARLEMIGWPGVLNGGLLFLELRASPSRIILSISSSHCVFLIPC